MKGIRNIIFDFDGTLVDTAPLIVSTMQSTNDRLALPPRSDDACRATIGLRLEEIPQVLWPGEGVDAALYAATYRQVFDELKRPLGVECYPGVLDTLHEMRDAGYGTAIASSRSHRSLVEYLDSFGMAGLFDMVVGGDDVAEGKPAPDAVLAVCDRMGWACDGTLVVGDAVYDVLMGQRAGARTCAVTYGNQDRVQLSAVHPDVMVPTFPSLTAILAGVSPETVEYVEQAVIPRYAAFDRAHREDHVRMVIAQSLSLAQTMPGVDTDMAYVVAAFHDTGLVNGRENHHIDSGKILAEDEYVCRRFDPGSIATMVQAVEDHRASNARCPRSVYGLIVAEADRFIDAGTIIRRTVQYGLAHYPELDTAGHYARNLGHLREKYGPGGYLKIWIEGSPNERRLMRLREIIADESLLRQIFMNIYREETRL